MQWTCKCMCKILSNIMCHVYVPRTQRSHMIYCIHMIYYIHIVYCMHIPGKEGQDYARFLAVEYKLGMPCYLSCCYIFCCYIFCWYIFCWYTFCCCVLVYILLLCLVIYSVILFHSQEPNTHM